MHDRPVTNQLEALMLERLEYLLEQPETELGCGKGLTRAMHIAALAERTYVAYFENDNHDGTPGFLPRTMRAELVVRLKNATLQPEEAKFHDVLNWRGVDKERLVDETCAIVRRLASDTGAEYAVRALEMYMLFDMRMRYNAVGYLSPLDTDGLKHNEVLAKLRKRCRKLVPGALAAA